MPLRWLREGLCARGRHARHLFWYVQATSHHSDALLHKADWAASQDTVLQNTPPDPGHAQLIVAGRDGHLDLRPPTTRALGEVAQRAQTDHALTHWGYTPLGATQRTPLPGTPPPDRTTEAPGGLGVFSGRPPDRPRRGHRHTDGPHGPEHLRQRPQDQPPRGTLLARPLPVAPTGTGGFTRPRHPPGQEDQDRSGGPPARPPAGRDAPTRARVQPHRTTPRPDPRGTPTTPPPPAPTTTTLPQHPNPAAQSAITAHTRPHHARTTIRAEPGDMAPPTPPPRPRPSQPLPRNAPMLQQPPPATSPPRPSTTRPHEPPTPHGTHHHTTPSRIPPPPAPTITPTNAGVPHTTSTPSTPPPRGPAPPAAPSTRAHDTRATVHPDGLAGSRARTPATQGPSRTAPPPPAVPPPTPHTSEHHPPAATHYIRTTAPPGRPCGRLPPTPRHHNQSRTARTARRTHARPTRPTGTPRPPASTTPTPAPPTTNSATPTPPPPAPPPETGPRTQHAAASTSRLTSMPPPTHATANPPTRDRHNRPHHRTSRATTTTTPPKPTPPPPSHPAPPAAAPAEPYAVHNPAAVRQHLWGLGEQDVLCLRTSGTSTRIRAATLVQAATLREGVRDFLFDAFLHVARHNPPHAPPQTARAHPPRPAGQPQEPPAVRAPPGAPAQGAGAPPAPAGRSRARPHPGLHRRLAGGGPHAAALRPGRGGDGRVPGDDGHGAQPPQVRHGHHGGGPGPAAAPLSPPGKPMALGTSGGLRFLPGTPAAAGRGVLPAAQAPATPGGAAPLVPQHPRATESGAGRHPGNPRGG